MSYDDFRRVDRHDPSTRRIASAQHYSPVLIVLTVLATAGILVYAVFLLNPANRGDLAALVDGHLRRDRPRRARPAGDVDGALGRP